MVFFGDNINKSIVQRVYDGIDNSDGMLIIGISLKVFSGYGFCRYAAKRKPFASLNPGLSDGDEHIRTIVRSKSDDALTPVLKRIFSSVP